MKSLSYHLRRKNKSTLGMSLVELVFAVASLVVFSSIYVLVLQTISRYFVKSEQQYLLSEGIKIDRQRVYSAFDQLVDILEQPGISHQDMLNIANKPCLSNPMSGDLDDPSSIGWGLPGPNLIVPIFYRFCLYTTSVYEAPSNTPGLPPYQPGIYILAAIPDSSSATALPVRRLFCRPKTYC